MFKNLIKTFCYGASSVFGSLVGLACAAKAIDILNDPTLGTKVKNVCNCIKDEFLTEKEES